MWLDTNRKSYMSSRTAPLDLTLSNPETWPSGPCSWTLIEDMGGLKVLDLALGDLERSS